jgi:hypothetical protein
MGAKLMGVSPVRMGAPAGALSRHCCASRQLLKESNINVYLRINASIERPSSAAWLLESLLNT